MSTTTAATKFRRIGAANGPATPNGANAPASPNGANGPARPDAGAHGRGVQVIAAVLKAPDSSCYEVLAKLALTCRTLNEAVCGLRKREAARLIGALVDSPDFDAGYGPELRKLEPLIAHDEYADLEELLSSAGGANFYVWAMLRLAYAERTCTLAAFTPMQFDFTDALFPLIGDGDTGEADGAIEALLEETELWRYTTKEQRGRMEWALWPASFAAQYNDSRGAVPPFVRLLGQLVAESAQA